MNLSEIRKKAQEQKAGNGAILPPKPDEAAVVAHPGDRPEEEPPPPCREYPVEELTPREALLRPETPPPAFDPLALLLAGRAAAQCETAAQDTSGLSSGRDATEFQEFLCFSVAAEKYAVNIMEIKEIIKPREVTEVPRVPSFVAGVLSLRGIIIPVFDMQKRLGHASKESSRARIIVVNKGEEICGILVDEVTQVVRISATAIEPPPAVLEGIDRDLVNGIGRFDGQMLILLNLGQVLDLNLH